MKDANNLLERSGVGVITYLVGRSKGRYVKRMVIINRDGELEAIEGTIDELCENAATIFAAVLTHIKEAVEEDGEKKKSALVLAEVLTEAAIRTVMDLMEEDEWTEPIVKACKTIGETGHISEGQYKVAYNEDGMMS